MRPDRLRARSHRAARASGGPGSAAFTSAFAFALALALGAAAPGAAAIPEHDAPAGAADLGGSPSDDAPGGVSARLFADVAAAAPGIPFVAAVEIAMQPGWHTYWENGGDAGLPTTIEWTLPPGWSAGPILWPAPHRYEEDGDIVTFGYSERVVLLTEVTPDAAAPAGSTPAEIRARVDWLQCKELCIPGGADLAMTLAVESAARPAGDAERRLVEASRAEVPVPATSLPGVLVHPFLSVDAVPPSGRAEVAVVLAGISGATPEGSVFLPRPTVEMFVRDGSFRSDGESLALLVPITLDGNVAPGSTAMLSAVCRIARKDAPAIHVAFDVPVSIASEGHVPVPTRAAVFSSETGAKFLAGVPPVGGEAAAAPASAGAILRFLVLAFLGGIILNVMPCVLPVISLKIMSFVSNANEDPKKVFRLGLAFAAGVLFSFLLLAGTVIALQAAGEMIGWGFQFQSPGFVAALAAIIFLFALSMLGLFEVNVPLGALARGGGRAYVDDFMNGMLATLLATPCTAPMLGPAVAFAFSQPPAIVVAIFLSVGLGLSVPYVLLTMNPKLLRFVPAPGAWMVTFKEVMGFVLLATLLWLLSVFGSQTGASGLVRLLAFLLILCAMAWIHGRFITLSSGRGARIAVWSLTVAAVILGYQRILEDALATPSESELGRPTAALRESRPSADAAEGAVAWAPFSQQTLDAAVASGSTVFLDFTAEWCWTCKVNEKTVLADAEVEDLLLEYDVVTLKGDWTRRDPEITTILKLHGRAGVPFYAVYPAGNPAAVIVLPELINKRLVLESIRNAGPSRSDRA